jgi:predicted hotdog family 3-hydroxylacyl-ACP dehydratase
VDLDALLPHRPPARLIERVLRADDSGAEAELTVQDPWLRRGALAEEALVEALAETCAVFASARARPGERARAGVLAAVSRFVFPGRARAGETVRLAVSLETVLGPLAAFEGVARVGEREVARGELRVAVL